MKNARVDALRAEYVRLEDELRQAWTGSLPVGSVQSLERRRQSIREELRDLGLDLKPKV